MTTSSNTTPKEGVFNPIGLAASMAFVYVLLFVALMLVSGKTIGMDGVVLPAFLIFLIITGTKYMVAKKKKELPQWLTVGSFVLASVMAIVMTILL